MSPTWTYDFIDVSLVDYANEGKGARWGQRADIGPYLGALNDAGRAGWEVIGWIPAPADLKGLAGWALVKRPL
jgi:hypothetical protein